MSFHETKRFVCTEDFPVADTAKGKIHGYLDNDVFTFHGIDYAHAVRFHEAEPTEAWEGLKKAHDYGPGCPEMTYSLEGKKDAFELILPQRLWYMSEDVQNLNIWTKSLDKSAKKPVMVWFHGGGFAGGAAQHLYSYEGYQMADLYDVVVVTVNHRLNMLGFLDLSDFGEAYKHSVNLGVLDLVEALKWVRDNITAFGGDPDNVTIYGQSGGGAKVCTLMGMPSADGLYHKAIIQSGVMRAGNRNPDIKKITHHMVKDILGLDKETISAIETMDYTKLANAVKQAFEDFGIPASGMMPWGPVQDNDVFFGSPLSAGFREEVKNVPIIAGSIVTEFIPSPIGNKAAWSDEKKMDLISKRFGEDAESAREAFEKAYPEVDYAYTASVDLSVRSAVVDFLSMKCREKAAPVYSYVMTFEQSYLGGIMLGHNTDLHFIFHNAMNVEGMVKEGVTSRLQDEMAGAWASFARSGDPNHEKMTEKWLPFTEEAHETYAFGDESMLKQNHDLDLLQLENRFSGMPEISGKKRKSQGILFAEE